MKAFILNSNLGTRFRFGKAMGAFTEETHNTQKTTSEYLPPYGLLVILGSYKS